jgi:aminomethyltransferase
MPNAQGGIVDDLIVYAIDAETYMLVVNAGNIKKDWDWICEQNEWNVPMEDISDQTALLAVQGPNAKKVIQQLTLVDLDQIPYYNFTKGDVAGIKNVLISHTGYTGAGGFELYVDTAHAKALWDALFEKGKDVDIKPIGLGARDTLRLEMGFCLYGNDITDTTSPIEAGLGWITKFTKTFTASEFLKKQKLEGITRKLVGFEMMDRGIPRHGYAITNNQGQIIGEVTSGTQSPSLQHAIGMGYIDIAYANVGNLCHIVIRNQQVKAKVVKIPFYKSTN